MVDSNGGAEPASKITIGPLMAFDLARSQDRVLFLVWESRQVSVPAGSQSASGFSYSRHLVTWQLGPKAPMAPKGGLRSLVSQQAMTFWFSGLGPGNFCLLSQVPDPV